MTGHSTQIVLLQAMSRQMLAYLDVGVISDIDPADGAVLITKWPPDAMCASVTRASSCTPLWIGLWCSHSCSCGCPLAEQVQSLDERFKGHMAGQYELASVLGRDKSTDQPRQPSAICVMQPQQREQHCEVPRHCSVCPRPCEGRHQVCGA